MTDRLLEQLEQDHIADQKHLDDMYYAGKLTEKEHEQRATDTLNNFQRRFRVACGLSPEPQFLP